MIWDRKPLAEEFPLTWNELKKLGVQGDWFIRQSLPQVNELRKGLGLSQILGTASVYTSMQEIEDKLNNG